MTMEMKPVASSSLSAIGHDPITKVLRVEFRSGLRYDYAGVEAHHVTNLLEAPSPGKYFADHIRGGGFAYTKVARDPQE